VSQWIVDEARSTAVSDSGESIGQFWLPLEQSRCEPPIPGTPGTARTLPSGVACPSREWSPVDGITGGLPWRTAGQRRHPRQGRVPGCVRRGGGSRRRRNIRRRRRCRSWSSRRCGFRLWRRTWRPQRTHRRPPKATDPARLPTVAHQERSGESSARTRGTSRRRRGSSRRGNRLSREHRAARWRG